MLPAMHALKLSTDDCERLKTFFVCWTDWFTPENCKARDPEFQPLAVRAGIEKITATNAKALQSMINETIEMTSNWSPEQVAQADDWLAAAGTFTLSEVRRRFSKKYLRILKRGVICCETEYYLVKGIHDGGGIESASPEDLKIEAMLNDFEVRLLASIE